MTRNGDVNFSTLRQSKEHYLLYCVAIYCITCVTLYPIPCVLSMLLYFIALNHTILYILHFQRDNGCWSNGTTGQSIRHIPRIYWYARTYALTHSSTYVRMCVCTVIVCATRRDLGSCFISAM